MRAMRWFPRRRTNPCLPRHARLLTALVRDPVKRGDDAAPRPAPGRRAVSGDAAPPGPLLVRPRHRVRDHHRLILEVASAWLRFSSSRPMPHSVRSKTHASAIPATDAAHITATKPLPPLPCPRQCLLARVTTAGGALPAAPACRASVRQDPTSLCLGEGVA